MLKKIICLYISLVLSFSVFVAAYADESKTLKDVCTNEETLAAIESMKETDKLELYIVLSYPEAEKFSYSIQSLSHDNSVSEEEIQAKRNELYEMYKSFCERFVKDYFLETKALCAFSPMIICNLTLDEIKSIINDERFERFSLTEVGIENDTEMPDGSEKLPDDHLFEETTDIEILLGDVDGNGSVTMSDVTMLQKFIAGIYNVEPKGSLNIMDHADVNRDNFCNMWDVVLIQRIIAKL